MEFIETAIFIKAVEKHINDNELRQLQLTLSLYPEMGRIIPASGGLRKLRWVIPGKGKRGGLRIIYYLIIKKNVIYLLYAYLKK